MARRTEDFARYDLNFHRTVAEASGNVFMASINGLVDMALASAFTISSPVDDGAAHHITVGNHRRVAELTRVQQLPHQGFHTLGLTEMRLGTRIDYRSPSLTHPDEPLACARPHIIVTLSLDPHVVSVASEFPEGGCAHRYIREHEMRHVKVNQHTLDDTATRMRQGLLSSFGNQVFYGTPAELENRFNRHIHGEWLPWVKAQMDQTLQLHREIDTPQEYARNRTVCNGEIARVLDAMR